MSTWVLRTGVDKYQKQGHMPRAEDSSRPLSGKHRTHNLEIATLGKYLPMIADDASRYISGNATQPNYKMHEESVHSRGLASAYIISKG